jgi:hypothetical protein
LPETQSSTIHRSQTPLSHQFHNHTIHIEVRHHFLRQLINDGQIQPMYLATREQLADALTKGLSYKKKFSAAMGLRSTN